MRATNQSIKYSTSISPILNRLRIYTILFLFFVSLSLDILAEDSRQKSGSIDFGRHTVTPFKYKVSSGQGGSYRAANLFDSNALTTWMSEKQGTEQWILVDFGEKRLIDGVEIVFPSWGFFRTIGHYKIQVNVWGEWRTISSNKNPNRTNIHNFQGFDASEIRIFFPNTGNRTVSVSDLKIFLGDTLLNGTESRLTGYLFPIEGGLIPEDDYSLPGAPRTYRNGYHKGIDIQRIKKGIFGGYEATSFSTEAVSIGDGTIIRYDRDYIPMIPEDFERQKMLTKTHPVTFVDKDFGGRQIWIDHGNGVISSYNHLSSLAKGLKKGVLVKKGQVIGTVGNSGLSGEAEGTDAGIHLHLEIWVDGEYLGKGLNSKQSRDLLEVFFTNKH